MFGLPFPVRTTCARLSSLNRYILKAGTTRATLRLDLAGLGFTFRFQELSIEGFFLLKIKDKKIDGY
jgi:hypothetical protein